MRILSIDGGGIRGVIPATLLDYVERKKERPICELFDLIAGTSTGGILALGLGMGLRAQDILDFYQQRGPRVFPAISIPAGIWYRRRNRFPGTLA